MDDFPSTSASSPFYTHKGANASMQLMDYFFFSYFIAAIVATQALSFDRSFDQFLPMHFHEYFVKW